MSKTIRVDDVTYARLVEFQAKRETLSAAVARLLDIYVLFNKALPLIHGAHNFLRDREEQEDAVRTARLERADLESRRLSIGEEVK